MFLERLIRPGPAKTAGRRLYAAMVAQAREPALYETYGAPDTPDGRFEIYTLHVLLVVQRLKGQGARAAAVSHCLLYTSTVERVSVPTLTSAGRASMAWKPW